MEYVLFFSQVDPPLKGKIAAQTEKSRGKTNGHEETEAPEGGAGHHGSGHHHSPPWHPPRANRGGGCPPPFSCFTSATISLSL